MKNRSFIVIVFISLIVFIALLFSLYNLVLKEATSFYADGYVSVTNSDVSEKIHFLKGSAYKNGYSDNVIFKNSENIKTDVSKYSFVFFSDKSINYLTDGVLMNLNNVNDKFIPYYNIKSNYLIKYDKNKYIIESTDKNIELENFIGRINESKYIVAGNDLKLKVSSSEELLSSYYFELNFIDGNMVKIDNDKINIETISDESYIMVGDKIKIDLNNKTIIYEDEVKVNLSEIVINHDSNIDILYKEEKEPDDDGGGGSGGTAPEPEVIDQYQTVPVVDFKKVPYVEIVNSSINAHKITLDFNVKDESNLISSSVKVRLLDVNNKVETIKEYSSIIDTIKYIKDSLTSNSKYIMTIYTSYTKNGNTFSDYVMFERTFDTYEIGLSLKKDYVTSSEIGYEINIDKDSTFTSATLALYDGETKVGEYNFDNNHQDINYTFDNLDSNKKYTAVLEDITYGAVSYPDNSNIINDTTTLKFNPFTDSLFTFSPEAIVIKKDYSVKFRLGEVNDADKAITGIVYNIYDNNGTEDTLDDVLVKTIKKENLNEFEFKFESPLEKDKIYYYKAVITLKDNEKVIDFETLPSNLFSMNNLQSPIMWFEATSVSANNIEGIFTIIDPDNTVDVTKEVYVEYTSSKEEGSKVLLEYVTCPEEEASTTKCARMLMTDLASNSQYNVSLFAYVDLHDENPGNMRIGTLVINTEIAEVIKTNMVSLEIPDENELFEKVFEVSVNMFLDETTDESVRDNLTSFQIFLYQGKNITSGVHLGSAININNESTNIVENFFDGTKNFTLSDFGLTLDSLRTLGNGIIAKDYTFVLKNGLSSSNYVEFEPAYINIELSDVLLGLANNDASVEVTPILNSQASEFYNSSLNTDTIVGVKISPIISSDDFIKNYILTYADSINYTISDVTDLNNVTSINYVQEIERDGEIIPDAAPITDILFTHNPEFLKRGRVYIISYTIELNFGGESTLIYPYIIDENNHIAPDPVKSTEFEALKQLPSAKMFIWTSSDNSIVYKYHIDDIDLSLGSNPDVFYKINDAEEYLMGVKSSCDTLNASYTTSFTCATFNNLNKDDSYKIDLQAKRIERESYLPDNVTIQSASFEGLYTLDGINYSILKNADNTSLYNNLLVIKVNGEQSLINRIADYQVSLVQGEKEFIIKNIGNNSATITHSNNIINYIDRTNTDNNKNSNASEIKKVAYVDTCPTEGTCIYIDYSKLYLSNDFKSSYSAYKNMDLTVNINTLYDKGKNTFYVDDASKVYSFKVINDESLVANKYYIKTGTTYGDINFNDNALGALYSYDTSANSSRFVDDDSSDNFLTGKTTFKNSYYSSANSSTRGYTITNSGVAFNLNTSNYSALVMNAKELAPATLTSDSKDFKFTKVVPTINFLSHGDTINGTIFVPSIYGVTQSDLTDNKVYFEVYNTDNTIVSDHSFSIDKNELEIKSFTTSDKTIIIPNSDNASYKYDVYLIKVNGTTLGDTDYSYDYRTGTITLKLEGNEERNIEVFYKIAVYGLNLGESYYIKAYMFLDGQKTYLIDGRSSTYEDFKYNFTTKTLSNVGITNASFKVNSNDNYINRTLETSYNIESLFGIDNISYEICDLTDNCQVVGTSSKGVVENDAYTCFGDTCIVKNGTLKASILHDISITEEKDFIFNQSYRLKINASITQIGSTGQQIIFDNTLPVRALVEPTLVVGKSSHLNAGKYSLKFDIVFTDEDRVINDGEYTVYLATDINKTKAVLYDNNGNTVQNERTISVFNNESIVFDNLNENTAYYLFIEYDTHINNSNFIPDKVNTSYEIPYLMYTLSNYGISVGKIQYTALADTSILRFGYASNIGRDILEDGSYDPNQEAYVAGIIYKINRISGDTYQIDGTKIFNDSDIKYYINTNPNEDIGDYYYEITLNNTIYPVIAWYQMDFDFYIGGKIVHDLGLTSKSACENNSISNYWDNTKNECYILRPGGMGYSVETSYGGAA